MTFSEFGRRVRENGSEGTDHGSSAPVMLFGPALRGSGFIGNHPSLTDLDRRGNMKYNIDFRSIYQTILTDWLCGDSKYINNAMLGENYELLGLGFNCDDKEMVDYDSLINYHYPIYSSGKDRVNLSLRLKQNHNISINVFDILGRQVSRVYSGKLQRGEHNFNLSENEFRKLSSGQYFYSINISGGKTLSKSFIVK
jgi:hypothetical protein